MPSTATPALTRRYALVGLTPRECSLLDSLFAMDADPPSAALTRVHQPGQADLLIVNGDDSPLAQRLRLAHPRALMVLAGQPPGGPRGVLQDVPTIARPMTLRGTIAVLGALDWPHPPAAREAVPLFGSTYHASAPGVAANDSRPPAAERPHAAARATDSARAFAPTIVAATAPATLSARQLWAGSQPAEPPARDDAAAPILLVRKSPAPGEPAGESTLAAGIRRMGYRVHEVHRPEAALPIVAQGAAQCVFLDQVSLAEQLWPLARALGQCRPPSGQPPQLVVVARRDSAMEQLRARMMACLWMHVPLRPEALRSLFARCGLQPALRQLH